MACTTTCPGCGRCYEETSEEEANSPSRLCLACYRERFPTAIDVDEIRVKNDNA